MSDGTAKDVHSTRGIIDPGVRKVLPQRRGPERVELADVVDIFWYTAWQLPPTQVQTVQTLPFPCQHLTFERVDGLSTIRITGLYRRVWQRDLRGTGDVFGIKFQPAGSRAGLGLKPAMLIDQTTDGGFLPDVATLAQQIWRTQSFERRCAAAEQWLLARAQVTERTRLANRLVASMQHNAQLRVGADVERIFALSARSINRLLTEQVGLSSKWILSRARLQSAADRLATEPQLPLAELAAVAGYADQAHFSRDFAAILGRTPKAYRQELAAHD